MLAAATAISFGFFYLGNKNVANITIVYTLALILTALYTSGYLFGIIASLFCVIAVNYLQDQFLPERISCHLYRHAGDLTDHKRNHYCT